MTRYIFLIALLVTALTACGEEAPSSNETTPTEHADEVEEVLPPAPHQAAAEPQADEGDSPDDEASPNSEPAQPEQSAGRAEGAEAPETGDTAESEEVEANPQANPLAEAIGAAAEAEGGTPCVQAWNGISAMFRTLERRLGAGSQGGAPDRDEFMELCEGMPPIVQQCMVMGYAMQNQAECREIMQGPEAESLRSLMTSRGGPPPTP